MTALLDAARQALPGLEWETDGESAVCRVSSAPHELHLSPLRGTNPELVFCGSDGYGAWARFRSIDEAAQWLRAQVTARRDALDAALGDRCKREVAIIIARAEARRLLWVEDA